MRTWGGNWGNVIIGKRGEGGLGWQLRRFGGDLRFSWTTRGIGDDDNPRSSIEPSLNEWHDVVAVRDGETKLLYIDGVLDSTSNVSGSVAECDHNVYIGARANGDNSGPEAFLDGDIDSLAIYGRALTEAEVRFISGLDTKVVDPIYVPPIYGPMRLHLEFAGDLTDSSGNGNDGTAVGTVAFETDPDMGQVLSLPGGDNQYVAVPPVGLSGNDPTTIACWAKADQTGIPDWTLVFGFTGTEGGGGGCGSHFNIGSIGGPQGIGAHAWCFEESIIDDEEALEWHHYAMTYDGTAIAYYGDGVPTDTDIGKSNVIDLGARADRVHVGSRITQGSSFPGKVDDARVYDYALSDAEIRYVAGLADKTVYGPMRVHLDFEADADDVSGNANEAILMGDAHVADGVLNLDGDDFVVYGKPDTLPTGKGPWSMCGWGKTDTVAGGWAWIAAWGNPTTGGAMFIGRNADDLFGGGYGDDLRSNDFWEVGEWHHIVQTYDGSTAALYADGKLLVSSARNWNLGNYYARVGRQVNNADEFWAGQLDDIRIYDYALTDAQIAGLAGATATNPISDTWSDLGMVDFALAAGTMGVKTFGWPGLPYYVGEVSRALPFADLTAGGGKALSTWVKGDSANSASIMYMSVADADGQSADVVYDGDVTDGEWVEWNVDMADLAGVDLTNAADIAIGLAGLDGGALGDVLNVDNIRVYTGRCMPDVAQPAADLNDDCIVDLGDLEVLIGEWGLQIQLQDWEHRVAYYDGRYPTGWADTAVAEGVRDYLSAAGYTVVDADELKTWMDARIADGALSVVVMCQDIAPDTVAETRDADCTLRKYLDAGGKVVQYADIPFYNQGHADGSTTNWATDGSVYILGFNAASAGWGSGNTVTITPAGANWGLTQTWNSHRPALAGDVDTILATDNDGDASAWAKRYVPGDVNRGFVYIADFDPGSGNLDLLNPALLSVAEAKGYLVADLSGDGAIGWMDVILMLSEWLDEELWPY